MILGVHLAQKVKIHWTKASKCHKGADKILLHKVM